VMSLVFLSFNQSVSVAQIADYGARLGNC